MDDADALLRALIWKRFGELYEQMPYSKEHHVLHCDTSEVADLTHRDSFSCCESCPYVEFTALIWCEHVQTEWTWGESGRLPMILSDMAKLEERTA